MYALDKIVTIETGQSQSTVIDTEFHSLVGIIMPAAWTAADLTFLVSNLIEGPFSPLFDDSGTEVEVTAAAGNAVGITGLLADALSPWRYVVLRSGTSVTPVNQAAVRDLIVCMK